ncbi:3'(2'),5'-bisphosphate nucleotidase CysQ [Candidatus Woesearchaeota archaeon]|nr:3'(2'),5'-bisphosphate nucleotidase CysQ [Candidatus Woesearchaeota archaeon]
MINDLIDIAKEAGKVIMEVYSKDFDFEDKKSSSFSEGVSPLTEADTAADKVIKRRLRELYPSIPVLSEEGKDISYSLRKKWNKFFLVDPLDGTKEFIKRNGEFTVNIALIFEGKPILGVVYVPVKDILYYGFEGGSFKVDSNDAVKLEPSLHDGKLRVVASKSHFNDETKEYIEKLGEEYELVNAGSSLKLCLVASNEADIYPRLGPTMEWDTAAAHAVVKFAGKKVLKLDGKELEYNKENLLNPYFVVK